jgi:quercetin dioxygenase-like cupin family protein
MTGIRPASEGFALRPGEGRTADYRAGRSFLFRATGDDTGGVIGVLEEAVPSGGAARMHVHHPSDELLYVLANVFTFQVGERQVRGGPGTLAFVPRGTVHGWRNTGAAAGRLLVLFTPAGYEQCIEAICALPAEERTPERNDAVSAPYAAYQVGPALPAHPEEAAATE